MVSGYFAFPGTGTRIETCKTRGAACRPETPYQPKFGIWSGNKSQVFRGLAKPKWGKGVVRIGVVILVTSKVT